MKGLSLWMFSNAILVLVLPILLFLNKEFGLDGIAISVAVFGYYLFVGVASLYENSGHDKNYCLCKKCMSYRHGGVNK